MEEYKFTKEVLDSLLNTMNDTTRLRTVEDRMNLINYLKKHAIKVVEVEEVSTDE